jgi:hypothetical protein
MQLPALIAKLPSLIIQIPRWAWAFVRWTNLLALGAGRFHTNWVQGIGAAIFCALWLSAIIGVYILNGIFGIDYAELGPLNWIDWLCLPIVAFLASNLGCIFIGRFLFSTAKVAALLAANNLPADSSIYKVGYRYGNMLWALCYFLGVVGLITAFAFLLAFLGIAPPIP